MNVIVLGCGPAGLIAAHAIERAGHWPIIISDKKKSVIPGSMYLHESIPGVTAVYPENSVQYIRMGTAEGYCEKVYGDADRETGWGNYFNIYSSWNVQACYDRLWERYQDRIADQHVTSELVSDLVSSGFEVVSTLPKPSLCYNPNHTFDSRPYWIRTLTVPAADRHRDIVVYNGYKEDAWYRWSILSGICSIEFTTPQPGTKQGLKVIDNDCDCWDPHVVPAGRWAAWRHGVLLHDAYKTTLTYAEELNGDRERSEEYRAGIR